MAVLEAGALFQKAAGREAGEESKKFDDEAFSQCSWDEPKEEVKCDRKQQEESQATARVAEKAGRQKKQEWWKRRGGKREEKD